MPARLLVLHGLRLKGFAEAEGLAGILGLPEPAVTEQLARLADEDLARHRDGRLSGWSLTPAGRAEHAKLIAADLDAAGRRDVVEACYRRFLGDNAALLELCTDWQVREGAPNDHTDQGYDHAVIQRLVALDEKVRPVVDDLAAALARFGGYRRRLDEAVARTVAGETEFFTKPMIDSYHTVWFELHEDLLVTLGLERSKEGTG